MATIYIPARSAPNWRALLADPERHSREGFSAMAASQSWEAADGLPPEIAAMFAPGTVLVLAIPKHHVHRPGRGAASQCNVFALVRESDLRIAVSIEAKVAEPFGSIVRESLRDAAVAHAPEAAARVKVAQEVAGLDRSLASAAMEIPRSFYSPGVEKGMASRVEVDAPLATGEGE